MNEEVIILKETDFINSYSNIYDKKIYIKKNSPSVIKGEFFKIIINYDKGFVKKNCKIILSILGDSSYVNLIDEERVGFFDIVNDDKLEEKVKSIIDEYIEIIKSI